MRRSSSVKECTLRARSTHGVHHAIVEVNIVIGVVLGEVHVVVRVHVIPLCDDAVTEREKVTSLLPLAEWRRSFVTESRLSVCRSECMKKEKKKRTVKCRWK